MLSQNVSNKYVLLLAFLAIIIGVGIASFAFKNKDKTEESQLRQIPSVVESDKTNSPKTIPENSQSQNQNQSKDKICIQVITPAKNPETGETEDFPTPCDVPEGWKIIDSSN